MIEVYERLGKRELKTLDGYISLDSDQRKKGRFRTTTDSGEEMRVFLERGHDLIIGEVLRSSCGKCYSVTGCNEEVLTAKASNWLLFSRACYHLGNRHVPIQIGDMSLRIKPDHVLEAMLRQLGLSTEEEMAVFVPESGAYAKLGETLGIPPDDIYPDKPEQGHQHHHHH